MLGSQQQTSNFTWTLVVDWGCALVLFLLNTGQCICHVMNFVVLHFSICGSCLVRPMCRSNLSFSHWPQIGNAAYHNDMLYEELRRSIPQLANLLLMAEEDKTKANAAGALSNLVRNSDKLCEDIVSKGAIQVCCILIFGVHNCHVNFLHVLNN